MTTLAFSAAFGRNLDYYTGAVFEIRDARAAEQRPIVGGGRYDRLLQTLGAPFPIPAVGCSIWIDRLAASCARLGHGTTHDARPAGSAAHPRRAVQGPPAGERHRLLRPRRPAAGAGPRRARLSRRHRRRADVEVLFLSASEIARELSQGGAHLGITGRGPRPQSRSPMPTQRLVLLTPLGFGHANVVVAVPQAWIDVRGMADLEDVASARSVPGTAARCGWRRST